MYFEFNSHDASKEASVTTDILITDATKDSTDATPSMATMGKSDWFMLAT